MFSRSFAHARSRTEASRGALLRLLRGLGLGCLLSLPIPASSQGTEWVDLELLLAVDTSLSVSNLEFHLQMQGFAQAFRHPAVISAIRAAGDRGIAVALMQWSDRNQQATSVDWMRISDAVSANAFASRVERTGRAYLGAGTSISGAIVASLPAFAKNKFEAPRRVLDISGDGIDNRGPNPFNLRPRALAAGVTINGLTILNEEPFLDRYYESTVIAGTGAFVVAATDYEDFARAIVAKLVREIAQSPVAQSSEPEPPG